MSKKLSFRGPALLLSDAIEGDVIEIQVLKTGNFFDPRYGKFAITRKLFSEMINNFKKGTLNKEVSLDYIHQGEDKAAAWFKDVYEKEIPGGHGLFAKVELTGSGKVSLSQKDFKYVSAEFDPKWKDNEKGDYHGCVLEGAGLTNRPVIKGMQSIQLSEGDGVETEDMMSYDDMAKELAELRTKCSELELKNKADPAPTNPLEGGTMTPEEKKLMEDKDAEIAKLKEGQASMEEKVQLSEKNSKFDKMLSDGKVVEAQRKPYIAGDMDSFSALAVKIKLSEDGNGTGHGGDGEGEESSDIEDKMAEDAQKMAADKKISLSEAVKIVAAMPKNKKALETKFSL